MRHPSGSRSKKLIATVLVAIPWVPTAAPAEIYKCFAKDKTPVYQNFPCQFSSMPSDLQAAKVAFAPAAATPPKPNAPVNAASPVKAPAADEPSVGRTREQIKAMLGAPLEIVQDEPAAGIETWRYLNRSVQFDRTQRVVNLESWN